MYIVNVLGATMYSPCGQIAEVYLIYICLTLTEILGDKLRWQEKKYTQHQSMHFKKRVRMQ